MTDLEYLARELTAIEERKAPYEMTPRRMRRLQSILGDLRSMIEFNLEYASLGSADMESAGEMEFLLNSSFPDGTIPERLQPYARLVGLVKGIGAGLYDRVVTAKQQKDEELLRAVRGRDEATREKAILEGIERSFYVEGLVGVIRADEVQPEKSRIQVLYGNDVLYEENIPDNVFAGLPEGTTVVFSYTAQGINLQLQRTLEGIQKKRPEAERVILEGLAQHRETREFVNDIATELESKLAQL